MSSSSLAVSLALSLLAPLLAFGQAQTRVRLLLDHDTNSNDQIVMAGLELRMPERWHTYWRNPSEPGGPGTKTKIDWTLPVGITAGEISWPVPEKKSEPSGVTHIYHDTVFLMVPLTIAKPPIKGPLELKARVSWLECETECVPGFTNVAARLSIGAQPRLSPEATRFEEARQQLPAAGSTQRATASWETEEGGEQRTLLIEWDTDAKTGDFFAYESKTTEISAKTEALPARTGKLRFRKTVTKTDAGWPASISGLLVSEPDSRERKGAHQRCDDGGEDGQG
jgi:DsbC/DsbD-like thiol-disulfide interchange protein